MATANPHAVPATTLPVPAAHLPPQIQDGSRPSEEVSVAETETAYTAPNETFEEGDQSSDVAPNKDQPEAIPAASEPEEAVPEPAAPVQPAPVVPMMMTQPAGYPQPSNPHPLIAAPTYHAPTTLSVLAVPGSDADGVEGTPRPYVTSTYPGAVSSTYPGSYQQHPPQQPLAKPDEQAMLAQPKPVKPKRRPITIYKDDLEEEPEDDEPTYVPRPSKRRSRGSA